jgi:hypothetical protein
MNPLAFYMTIVTLTLPGVIVGIKNYGRWKDAFPLMAPVWVFISCILFIVIHAIAAIAFLMCFYSHILK